MFPPEKPWAYANTAMARMSRLNNLAPADVYFGHGHAILKQRETIKRRTIESRRLKRLVITGRSVAMA